MGQKVNPISFRLAQLRGWESHWFAKKETFVDNLREDNAIRNCLFTHFPAGIISKSVIERTLKKATLTIHSSKPGVLIGPGGTKLAEFIEKLKKTSSSEVQVNVSEVRNPEIDAYLVGQSISTQIKAYMPYKRVIRHAISSTMSAGAKGIKIRIGGRLAGAEIARSEEYKEGRIPLHTLRADIDYASITSLTSHGVIGIKVWIFKKHVYGKRDLSLNLEVRSKQHAQKRYASTRKP